MTDLTLAQQSPDPLVVELRQLISEARRQAAATVNAGLTVLYWSIGDRIRRSVLGSERAGYGERILATLSQDMSAGAKLGHRAPRERGSSAA